MFGFLKKLRGGGNSLQSVTPQEARQLIKGGAVLLNVREAGERETRHIPGSKHTPRGQLTSQVSTLQVKNSSIEGKGVLCFRAFDIRKLRFLAFLCPSGTSEFERAGRTGTAAKQRMERVAMLPRRTRHSENCSRPPSQPITYKGKPHVLH